MNIDQQILHIRRQAEKFFATLWEAFVHATSRSCFLALSSCYHNHCNRTHPRLGSVSTAAPNLGRPYLRMLSAGVGHSMPGHSMPGHSMPGHSMPGHSMPGLETPCNAVTEPEAQRQFCSLANKSDFWRNCLACIIYGCLGAAQTGSAQSQPVSSWQWTLQSGNATASLRGLSVVDAQVAWASGSEGTVLRTTNGGTSWQALSIPKTDSVDFRDVAAFDAQTAYVLSAGQPALIYKTTDGGASWQQQHYDTTKGIFYDAFAFWDPQHGIAMSDPVQNHFVLIRTTDGEHWKPISPEQTPSPLPGEAGFAASGTGLVVQGERHVWFATGGKAARVFYSTDRGERWRVAETPMIQGQSSTGIFSLAFQDTVHGVAVGGKYLRPGLATDNACFTTDGGSTWQLATTSPRGYRSGVAFLPDKNVYVAVGPTGSDYSADGGKTWQPADTVGYHAIGFAPDGSVGWATGAAGKIVKIIP